MLNQLVRRMLPLGAIALVAPSLLGVSASAAAETTPPTLNLPTRGSFVPLSTISATAFDFENGWPLSTSVDMRAQWSATDASGICGYSIREVYDDSVGEWSAWSRINSVRRTVTDYDDQEGGGVDKFWGYEVQARDCAGNVTSKLVLMAPVVYQQDGLSYRYDSLNVTVNGAWATTPCACWSAGTALRTTSRGARIDFSMPAMPADASGSDATFPIALIMERAPDRGRARILVDGLRVATIDTGAAMKMHRSIVWVGSMSGTQTLSVVNLATPGRPRIDVDAVVSHQR
jgi:hypothetical protein